MNEENIKMLCQRLKRSNMFDVQPVFYVDILQIM